MFRNPRENRSLPSQSKLPPSSGRSPSPPRFSTTLADMTANSAAKQTIHKAVNTASKPPKKTQTTLVPSEWSKKALANAATKNKPKATPNGNIMTFFKKAEDINNRIFMQERGTNSAFLTEATDEDVGWNVEHKNDIKLPSDTEKRYNENGGSIKRRKGSGDQPLTTCVSTQSAPVGELSTTTSSSDGTGQAVRSHRKAGPFIDDSDSEEDDLQYTMQRQVTATQLLTPDAHVSKPLEDSTPADDLDAVDSLDPLIRTHSMSQDEQDEFDGIEDFEDDRLLEGEEHDERRWLAEQRMLELTETGFDIDMDDTTMSSKLLDGIFGDCTSENQDNNEFATCPICSATLIGLKEQEIQRHVNACLDSNPLPISGPTEHAPGPGSNVKKFKQPPHPARPGQANPFQLGDNKKESKSAFSKLMANHAEDAAWASAAAAESASRGKPSFQRTCPFYKILPGFFICVDAFRYGAVKGQNAYFLSHFHSDHYIGLTSTWSHGPIYCSKVTGNLVRQQLRVNPRYVVDLEFEVKTEVPGTEGVHVTMIPANHCPGSSLFLFEKHLGKKDNPRLQRVLHCGDFRACRAHIEHPLLRPDVMDKVSGKERQQKLDVCYLDTTYLNPKYAFPPQHEVIKACADKCVALNNLSADEKASPEKSQNEVANHGIGKFIRKGSEVNNQNGKDQSTSNTAERSTAEQGRLLVVVGTYSIGKERICIGIAKALETKIYAPPNKQRICHALEDPELNALLTSNPREAQVHMTPLFEIRAETLDDYLRDYSDTFSRAVGFRPSGWNYRPPNSRFTDSPSINNVLYSRSWKSEFSVKDLSPQRGSTNKASCFGVPYSEHSSFRELTMFCCSLKIDKIIPTVNIGSAKSREKMKGWCEKWAMEKKKNGLFKWTDLGDSG